MTPSPRSHPGDGVMFVARTLITSWVVAHPRYGDELARRGLARTTAIVEALEQCVSGTVPFPPPPKRRHIRPLVARLRSAWRAGTTSPIGVEQLRIRCRRSRDRHIVEASGTLNAHTRAGLTDALEIALESDAGQIVLDLGGLASIDHSGLDTVLTAHLRAGDDRRTLVIIPGPDQVQRVFDDARAPFLYASPKPAGMSGRARTRSRRAWLDRPSGSPATRPRSGRRAP